MGRFKALWREKEKKLKPLMKIEENSNILEDTSDNLIHWSRHISNYINKCIGGYRRDTYSNGGDISIMYSNGGDIVLKQSI